MVRELRTVCSMVLSIGTAEHLTNPKSRVPANVSVLFFTYQSTIMTTVTVTFFKEDGKFYSTEQFSTDTPVHDTDFLIEEVIRQPFPNMTFVLSAEEGNRINTRLIIVPGA